MGVYSGRELSGYDAPELGLKIGPIKIGTKKLEAAAKKAVKQVVKPVANVAAKLLPGPVGIVARALVPGVAKPKPKPAAPAPAPVVEQTAAGSPSAQIQRALSTRANRPATAIAPKAKKKTPAPAAVAQTPQTATAVISNTVADAKKKLSLVQKIEDKVGIFRDAQRKLSDTARRASINAQTIAKRAEAAAAAGDSVGASKLAEEARKVADVAQAASGGAQQVAQAADAAGAGVSAGVNAGIAAAATGDAGAGVAAEGIFELVKEHPIAAAGVGGLALYTLARAFGGGRRAVRA